MCYAIIGLTPNRVKTHISNYSITGQRGQTHYPSMHSVDKLSQHAVAKPDNQTQAREVRHTIPACIVQTSYPNMQ